MSHSFRMILVLAVMLIPAGLATGARVSKRFDFGPGKAAEGYVQVLPGTRYSDKQGYGFEPGSEVVGIDRGGSALEGDFCTSDRPFSFSVAVPEGNYAVSMVFGDPQGLSASTVKAELRRLMLENVTTAMGRLEDRTIVVNVRTPKLLGGGEVRLKNRERETEWAAWDNKLTLEFNGSRPCVVAVEVTPIEVPTVFILGDSTVCDQPLEPYASWGQMLPRFFKPQIAVANHAESGESLRSSLSAHRVEKVLESIRKGDFLLIQYGHNDMKAVDEATYQASLRNVAALAREKGATVVLITPMHRRRFQGDSIQNSLKGFPDAVRQLAKEQRYPLIDLHAMSETLYEALGPDGSGILFKPGDGTHHNNYGAYELARCVVDGIRRNESVLADFLKEDLPPFDPAHPDPVETFQVPASPRQTTVPPEGQ